MDTEPRVAWFCPKDQHHPWALEAFSRLPTGGLVCEAVLAEACHLVAKDGVAPGRVIQFVERGGLTLTPLAGQLAEIRGLLDRYRNIRMDFADACVVRLAQLEEQSLICTTDSDFSVYQREAGDQITLLAPFAA